MLVLQQLCPLLPTHQLPRAILDASSVFWGSVVDSWSELTVSKCDTFYRQEQTRVDGVALQWWQLFRVVPGRSFRLFRESFLAQLGKVRAQRYILMEVARRCAAIKRDVQRHTRQWDETGPFITSSMVLAIRDAIGERFSTVCDATSVRAWWDRQLFPFSLNYWLGCAHGRMANIMCIWLAFACAFWLPTWSITLFLQMSTEKAKLSSSSVARPSVSQKVSLKWQDTLSPETLVRHVKNLRPVALNQRLFSAARCCSAVRLFCS